MKRKPKYLSKDKKWQRRAKRLFGDKMFPGIILPNFAWVPEPDKFPDPAVVPVPPQPTFFGRWLRRIGLNKASVAVPQPQEIPIDEILALDGEEEPADLQTERDRLDKRAQRHVDRPATINHDCGQLPDQFVIEDAGDGMYLDDGCEVFVKIEFCPFCGERLSKI